MASRSSGKWASHRARLRRRHHEREAGTGETTLPRILRCVASSTSLPRCPLGTRPRSRDRCIRSHCIGISRCFRVAFRGGHYRRIGSGGKALSCAVSGCRVVAQFDPTPAGSSRTPLGDRERHSCRHAICAPRRERPNGVRKFIQRSSRASRPSRTRHRCRRSGARTTTGIIPVAGQGSRLGVDRPKALVEIGGRTLLSYVLDALSPVVDSLVLVVMPGAETAFEDEVRALGWIGSVRISVQATPSGSADAVRVAIDVISDEEPCVLVWGDQVGLSRNCDRRGHGTRRRLPWHRAAIDRGRESLRLVLTRWRCRQSRTAPRRDISPLRGMSDVGTFGFLAGQVRPWLAVDGFGDHDAQREPDFVYVVPQLAASQGLRVIDVGDATETLGVNDPNDLNAPDAPFRKSTMTNVVVFSGGRGAATILRSLARTRNVRLSVVINAYDWGSRPVGFVVRSTACWDRVTSARTADALVGAVGDPSSRRLAALLETRLSMSAGDARSHANSEAEFAAILDERFDLVDESLVPLLCNLTLATWSQLRESLTCFQKHLVSGDRAFDYDDLALGNAVLAGLYVEAGFNGAMSAYQRFAGPGGSACLECLEWRKPVAQCHRW